MGFRCTRNAFRQGLNERVSPIPDDYGGVDELEPSELPWSGGSVRGPASWAMRRQSVAVAGAWDGQMCTARFHVGA